MPAGLMCMTYAHLPKMQHNPHCVAVDAHDAFLRTVLGLIWQHHARARPSLSAPVRCLTELLIVYDTFGVSLQAVDPAVAHPI
jgi:hypothetical protein